MQRAGWLKLAEFLADKLNLQDGQVLLDVSFNRGYQTCFLAKEYPVFVVGIDPWADRAGLPPASYALYTELALVVVLVAIVFWLGWWGEIGLRRPRAAAVLGNFMAFVTTDSGQVTGGEVTAQVWIVSLAYIVLFTVYGLYLMRRKARPTSQVSEAA